MLDAHVTIDPTISNEPVIVVGPGKYLVLECLASQDSGPFYMVDYTAQNERGREWEIRRDRVTEDFRDAWGEFQMLHDMRRPKPMEAVPATGQWVHGDDGQSEWVSFDSTVPQRG